MAYGGEYETPDTPGQPGNPQASGAGGDLTYEFLGFDANNKDVYRGSDGKLYTGDPNGMAGMGLYYGPGVEPDYQQPVAAPPPLALTPPMHGGVPEAGGGYAPGGEGYGQAWQSPGAPIAPPGPTVTPPRVPSAPSAPAGPPPMPGAPAAPVGPTGPGFNPNDDAFGYELPEIPGFTPPTYTPPPAFMPPTFTPPPAFEAPTFTPPPAFSYENFQLPDAQAALTDPGYQFRLKQGEQALLNNRAARGLLSTGGTLKDFLGYNQNFATQEYGNVLDRAVDTYKTNRGNALDSYTQNYKTQYVDPFEANSRAALDTYNQNYKTQYVDPFEANYKSMADAYEQNYKSQYLDPYEAQYKQAQDVQGVKQKEWQERVQKLQHDADERRRYAWLLASG